MQVISFVEIYNATIVAILPYMCSKSVLVRRCPFCHCLENKLWNCNLTSSYCFLFELPNMPVQVYFDFNSKCHAH